MKKKEPDPRQMQEAQELIGAIIKTIGGQGHLSSGRRRGRPPGRSLKTLETVEAIKRIVGELAPITVRGVCYRLFTMGLIKSMATTETQRVSRILTEARDLGDIDWEDIVDETRPLERKPQWGDVTAFTDSVKHQYRKDFWATQKYCIQIHSEKATVGGILRPVINEYGVYWLAHHGFTSTTKAHELAEFSSDDDRELIMLYVGDHDPSGMYMSEVDLPQRLEHYGGEFTLHRIALTADDVRGDSLPSFQTETKRKDPRYQWYHKNYGERAWELDAMNPNDLRARVEAEILKYVDPEAWARHQLAEKAECDTIEAVMTRWAPELTFTSDALNE